MADQQTGIGPEKLLGPALRSALIKIPTQVCNVAVEALAQIRLGFAVVDEPCIAELDCEECVVPASPGQLEVKVLVFNAGQTSAAKPGVLYVQGGGMTLGSFKSQTHALTALAREHNCVVVSVEYPLCPETNDCHAALEWLRANADLLGVNPQQLVLMGEGVGADILTQLSLELRDKGTIPVQAQLLAYPMLDDRTDSAYQPPNQLGACIWPREANRLEWSSYLGVKSGGNSVPLHSVPARETNLLGLPPTWIGVSRLDLLCEEDILFASRLLAAGVPTELLVVPGVYHGFDHSAPTAAATRQFTAPWNSFLRRILTQSPLPAS